jgi:hypothetical protein
MTAKTNYQKTKPNLKDRPAVVADSMVLDTRPTKKNVSAKLKQRKAKKEAQLGRRIERAMIIAGIESQIVGTKEANKILYKEAIEQELRLAMNGSTVDHLDKGAQKRVLNIRQRYLPADYKGPLPDFDELVVRA